MSFQKEVWDNLRKISPKTETKQGFTYVPWSVAWGELMNHYPRSDFEYGEVIRYPDDTAAVEVTVTVVSESSRNEQFRRTERLPVLNGNKPVTNPNSFAINTAYKRCLVKCLAHCGLGLHIYEGEDVPLYTNDEAKERIWEALALANDPTKAKFWKACGVEPDSSLDTVPDEKLKPALKWLREQVA